MTIDSKLLEILVCPKCKNKVNLTADENALRCTNTECRLIYPIRDSIPVMLVEEAKTEE